MYLIYNLLLIIEDNEERAIGKPNFILIALRNAWECVR